MRKNNIFYMFCAFLSLFFCNASFAGVSIGVPLSEDASCNFVAMGEGYKSDWSTNCNLSGYPSVAVSGIGICSSYKGESGEVYSGQLQIGGATCWCRMLLPVVSKWVSNGTHETEASCYSNCAYRCVNALYTMPLSEPSAVKKAMFGQGNLMYE